MEAIPEREPSGWVLRWVHTFVDHEVRLRFHLDCFLLHTRFRTFGARAARELNGSLEARHVGNEVRMSKGGWAQAPSLLAAQIGSELMPAAANNHFKACRPRMPKLLGRGCRHVFMRGDSSLRIQFKQCEEANSTLAPNSQLHDGFTHITTLRPAEATGASMPACFYAW